MTSLYWTENHITTGTLYLDVPELDREPGEDGNETHDETGHGQLDGALQPVEGQDARAGVVARVAAGRAVQTLEARVVVVRLVLGTATQNNNNKLLLKRFF